MSFWADMLGGATKGVKAPNKPGQDSGGALGDYVMDGGGMDVMGTYARNNAKQDWIRQNRPGMGANEYDGGDRAFDEWYKKSQGMQGVRR